MDTDVVVIGAGAAGIAAALELSERSLRVIVFEGSGRIGGRVLPRTIGSVAEPVELGAEFIHGDAPQTSALLREAGLRKIETSDDSWQCSDEGVLEPDDDDFASNDLWERVRTLDADESVDTFLRRFAGDPALRDQAKNARAFVEGFEAADPALASARAIADELGSGVDSVSTRPVGSYAPLVAFLGDRLTSKQIDLRLNSAVERITWKRGEVTIEGRTSGGAAFVVTARSAIVTVSVGVLRATGEAASLTFSPPLPDTKQTSLRGLEMGRVVRVALSFRTPFWESIADGAYRDAAFFHCDGRAFNAFWTQMPTRGRTIVAWSGGPRATSLEEASMHDRIERARDEFGTLLGEPRLAREEFEDGATHDWSTDRYTRGAYSYVATGGGDARAVLGQPIDDTLFFAGEATSTNGQGGTVSGAFETGTRAAREAADALAAVSAATPATS